MTDYPLWALSGSCDHFLNFAPIIPLELLKLGTLNFARELVHT